MDVWVKKNVHNLFRYFSNYIFQGGVRNLLLFARGINNPKYRPAHAHYFQAEVIQNSTLKRLNTIH